MEPQTTNQIAHSQEVLNAVAALFTSRPVNEFFSRLEPESVIDDLRQEMFLKLLEKPVGYLSGVVERNELFALLTGMAKRTITSTKTSFHRLQRKETGVEIPTTFEGFQALEDSGQIQSIQIAQDQEAVNRHGEGFISYTYAMMPKRMEPKPHIEPLRQIAMF